MTEKQSKKDYLGYFYKLASLDEKERILGTEGLFECLNVIGEEDVRYCFKRLVKGLGSSRDAARQGFSLSLSQFLTNDLLIDKVLDVDEGSDYSVVWRLVKKGIEEGTPKSARQDKRDHFFGLLFGSLSIVLSLINRNSSPSPSSSWKPSHSFFKEISSDIIDLATEKSYLDSSCWSVMCLLLSSCIHDKSFYFDGILPAIKERDETFFGPGRLQFALAAESVFPGATIGDLGYHNLDSIANALKESTFHPLPGGRLHPVWENVLMGFVFPSVDHELASPSGFWKSCVDSLFTGSLHQKQGGFKVLQSVFSTFSGENFPKFLVGPEFLRCFSNQLSSRKTKSLHEDALATMQSLRASPIIRNPFHRLDISFLLFGQHDSKSVGQEYSPDFFPTSDLFSPTTFNEFDLLKHLFAMIDAQKCDQRWAIEYSFRIHIIAEQRSNPLPVEALQRVISDLASFTVSIGTKMDDAKTAIVRSSKGQLLRSISVVKDLSRRACAVTSALDTVRTLQPSKVQTPKSTKQPSSDLMAQDTFYSTVTLLDFLGDIPPTSSLQEFIQDPSLQCDTKFILEAMIAALEIPSSLLRDSVIFSFKLVCPSLSDSSLTSLIHLVTSDPNHPLEDEGEGIESDETDEQDEGSETENSNESETDATGDLIVEAKNETDGIQDVSFFESDDNPDHADPLELEEYDKRLASMVQHLKEERVDQEQKGQKEFQLKTKVLDLLEIVLKKKKSLSPKWLMPLLTTALRNHAPQRRGSNERKIFREKLTSILEKRLLPSKVPCDQATEAESLTKQMEQLWELCKKKVPREKRFNQRQMQLCANAISFFCRNLGDHLDTLSLTDFFRELLSLYFSKKSSLDAIFFVTLLQKQPWIGWKSFAHLLEVSGSAKTDYLKVQPFVLIHSLVRQKEVLTEHFALDPPSQFVSQIFELLESYLSSHPSSSRLKQVIKETNSIFTLLTKAFPKLSFPSKNIKKIHSQLRKTHNQTIANIVKNWSHPKLTPHQHTQNSNKRKRKRKSE